MYWFTHRYRLQQEKPYQKVHYLICFEAAHEKEAHEAASGKRSIMGTIAHGAFKAGGTLRGYVLAPLLGDIGISFKIDADPAPKTIVYTLITSLNPANLLASKPKKDVEVTRAHTPLTHTTPTHTPPAHTHAHTTDTHSRTHH